MEDTQTRSARLYRKDVPGSSPGFSTHTFPSKAIDLIRYPGIKLGITKGAELVGAVQ